MSMTSAPANGWMGKILGVFKKPQVSTISRLTSAVASDDIALTLSLWDKVSQEDQEKTFDYCVQHNKYDMVHALLPLVRPLLGFEHAVKKMEEGDRTWFNHFLDHTWTDQECAQLAIIAALVDPPLSNDVSASALLHQKPFLDFIYTKLGPQVERALASKEELMSWASRLSSLPTPLNGHRMLSPALSCSVFDGMNDWVTKIRAVLPARDHGSAILAVASKIKKGPTTSGLLEGFEQLVAPLHQNDMYQIDISRVFTITLNNGDKQCLDILFKHYPNYQFSASDLLTPIKEDDQSTFDMVLGNITIEQLDMDLALNACVTHDRPHMFDQLFPMALAAKCNFYRALFACAKTNNVNLVNKLLPFVNPKGLNNEALQLACAYGSEDVFNVLYPLSDPVKALKALRQRIERNTQFESNSLHESIPPNTALLDMLETHTAISNAIPKAEVSAEPQRKRRM